MRFSGFTGFPRLQAFAQLILGLEPPLPVPSFCPHVLITQLFLPLPFPTEMPFLQAAFLAFHASYGCITSPNLAQHGSHVSSSFRLICELWGQGLG